MKAWIRPIKKLGACSEALEWAEDYDNLQDAWDKCERGDWMLWLLGKQAGIPESDSRKKLVLAACQCARLTLPYVKEGEGRPLKAIETAEAWAHSEGGVTLIDVRDAAYSAYAAAYAAYSAYAAAYAAYAAYSAYATAYAATAAAYAADDRTITLKQCADIVRGYYATVNLNNEEG